MGLRVFPGGGATRPLLRDGGVEELHGYPTVLPRMCSYALFLWENKWRFLLK